MTMATDQRENTFLTFHLDQEVYGLGIVSVREVLEYMPITKVPRTSECMCGLVNVRGQAVPVIDLRAVLGLKQAEATVETCIIIGEAEVQGDSSILGFLVDGVQEVVDISPEQIESAPRLGSRVNSECVSGIARLASQFVILLSVQSVFALQDVPQAAESDEERSYEGKEPATG